MVFYTRFNVLGEYTIVSVCLIFCLSFALLCSFFSFLFFLFRFILVFVYVFSSSLASVSALEFVFSLR